MAGSEIRLGAGTSADLKMPGTKQDVETAEPTGSDCRASQSAAQGEESDLNRDVIPTDSPCLSKSQQKKLKRRQDWEDGREDRKKRRRERLKAAKMRKREAIDADPTLAVQPRNKPMRHLTVPVTVIIDCAFDDLMNENEVISLGTQLTRSYADTKKAEYQANLCISGWNGRLKERFDGLMEGAYRNWKGVKFRNGDLGSDILEAQAWMKGQSQWKYEGALGNDAEICGPGSPERRAEQGEVIYLSSDSPNTLETLQPFGTYIIGGLVDKNRHKGVCYKRATDAGIRTAKLPIGDYIKMSSRQVLATCHVNEIMHKWLALGDWGAAFTAVIPGRKGGVLRNEAKQRTSLEDQEVAGKDPEGQGKGKTSMSDSSENSDAAG